MRIGIVTGEYPPMQGGVGAYTAILAQQLAEHGQEVHLFSTQAARENNLPMTNTSSDWGFSSLPAVAEWAKKAHLDLINIQFQTAAFGMSPWVHFLPDYLRSTPVVTTFHDLRYPYLFPKAGPLRTWIVRHLARASRGVIVTNHEDAQRVEYLPRRRMIPIGSNITGKLASDFNAAVWRQSAGASQNDFLLSYFGLINRSKGLNHLLDSIAALRERQVPIRLLMIGGTAGTSDPTNAGTIAEIQQIIVRAGLEDCIYQTGYLEDNQTVGSYLKASDAVVLPFLDGASFRRGSLMAAIHYDCCIVTTRPNVPVPEFVGGENMLLVPAGDTSSLTHALYELYEKPVLRQHLRQGATQLARRFDWEHIAAAYVDFFETILRGQA